MVGEGTDRRTLEEFAAARSLRNVVFAGFVNQSSIGKYYASADALVSTSEYDPHPLVVPEAGCFGLPVVVSDRLGCIGAMDTARPGVNALVYPWSDIEELSNCILKMHGDRGSTARCRVKRGALQIRRRVGRGTAVGAGGGASERPARRPVEGKGNWVIAYYFSGKTGMAVAREHVGMRCGERATRSSMCRPMDGT